MTTDTIKQGASAVVIDAVMPSKWDNPDSVTVSIYRTTGAALLEDEDVTTYAGDTLSSAAASFTKSCILDTGNALEDGETVNIGSDAQGYQELVVDSYVASTQVLTFKDRFEEALPIGAAVIGRNMSVEIDTSTDDWNFIGDVTVEWTPVGISAVPWTESYSVLKRESAGAGLESAFRDEFDDYYPHVSGHFDRSEKTARAMVRRHLKLSDRDLNKIVDSAEYDYLIMTRMALNIANAHGAQFDSRAEKLSESYDMQLSILIDSFQWEDTNQDLVQDESEVSQGSRIGIRRGY